MQYQLISLRDVVIFPGITTPLFVGRRQSIAAVEKAVDANMQVVLVSQKAANVDKPTAADVYDVGTLADIVQVLKLPDGTLKLLVEGQRRVRISRFLDKTLTSCEVTYLEDRGDYDKSEEKAVRSMLLKAFSRYLKSQDRQAKEILKLLEDVPTVSHLCDAIAAHSRLVLKKKMDLLGQTDVQERVALLLTLLENEQEIVTLEQSIARRVKSQMDKNQKEYYLNEQAKAIQKELENLDESKTDFGQLKKAIKACKMPKNTEKKCLDELEKLKKMPSMSSEATVLRNYLETMIAYPWSKSSKTNENVAEAKAILEASHYGLEDVKERIIEYIAVQQRTQKPSGSILCLVGPPGVGKTSIGKSIAKAVNREYVRMALGGVRDEAEIRGHRRTYIGAMPGRIVQHISKSKVNNPLFLLDEIDKMGKDHRGDPASAMLEVLDPEQNHTFNDHYMEEDMDLSKVFFIATANSLDIPDALLDRMEVIRIPGYTESEKLNIGKNYLLPRNLSRNGLQSHEMTITDKALSMIVENYTREAGVRKLDRALDKMCRKIVTELTLSDKDKVSVSQNNLADYLGVPKYERDNLNNRESIGRINGLAWTSVGGELLNIEVAVLPGKGKVSLTGKLGEVMQESIQAAMTVVKSHVSSLGVSHTFFQEHDFHIHLPEAATPKDGPSAGTAMTTALLSAVMQIPVSHRIAMTGEITLLGNVLPIGGLKEKLFAAARENIETVFIPQKNHKDLREIADEIKEKLTIVPVGNIDELLSAVFSNKLNKKKKTKNSFTLVDKYRSFNQVLEQKH
ncbi:MAG: endopeptidase La [Gammaproteobacteria bacterium]|nr:MAG: endopeptidase La [Gammaproteobacteria bacterium]